MCMKVINKLVYNPLYKIIRGKQKKPLYICSRYTPLLSDLFDLTFVEVFCSFSKRSIKNPINPEIFSLPNNSINRLSLSKLQLFGPLYCSLHFNFIAVSFSCINQNTVPCNCSYVSVHLKKTHCK